MAGSGLHAASIAAVVRACCMEITYLLMDDEADQGGALISASLDYPGIDWHAWLNGVNGSYLRDRRGGGSGVELCSRLEGLFRHLSRRMRSLASWISLRASRGST
jgi:hypothetical protein